VPACCRYSPSRSVPVEHGPSASARPAMRDRGVGKARLAWRGTPVCNQLPLSAQQRASGVRERRAFRTVRRYHRVVSRWPVVIGAAEVDAARPIAWRRARSKADRTRRGFDGIRIDVHVVRGRGRGSECAAQGPRGALSRRGRTAATRARGRTSEGRLRRTSRAQTAEEREARAGSRAADSEFQHRCDVRPRLST
jgi:hypothetical protein